MARLAYIRRCHMGGVLPNRQSPIVTTDTRAEDFVMVRLLRNQTPRPRRFMAVLTELSRTNMRRWLACPTLPVVALSAPFHKCTVYRRKAIVSFEPPQATYILVTRIALLASGNVFGAF